MQTAVNLQTATENLFISTVLLPHTGKCTGEYTGKLVDRTAVITCPKCKAEHVVKLDIEPDMVGAVEE